MTNAELSKYVKHYVEKDKTKSAIMLTAEWGTGKSHYITNELIPFLEGNGGHKCIVVSLYGLSSVNDISKSSPTWRSLCLFGGQVTVRTVSS